VTVVSKAPITWADAGRGRRAAARVRRRAGILGMGAIASKLSIIGKNWR